MLKGTRVGIAVEWCRHCKGIFLDPGELERIGKSRQHQLNKDRLATGKASASVALDVFVWSLIGGFWSKD
jgi:Zn-finger nucleic acid-binding protein